MARLNPWGEEGPYFEDFEVGLRIWSWPCRTLSEIDNVLWASFSGDSTPLYIDRTHARRIGYRDTPIHPLIILNLTLALAVRDTSMNTLAFLGSEYMRIYRDVYPGDTICVESEVAYKRESRSRPYAGIITWIHRAYNQDRVLVAEVKRTNLVYKRAYSPWRKFLKGADVGD
ncbi:MAG: MaoC family dehydratase [Desulfurococcales archaeon]|nr:MaoC family dehydratase [Desulfurococcales archaeon]